MKIRSNYVSNSSSSSFVINNFNKDKFIEIFNKYLKVIDYDSEFNFNKIDEKRIKDCVLKKISITNTKNLKGTYVRGSLFNLADNAFHYFIAKREFEIISCNKCKFYKKNFNKPSKECLSCSNYFKFRKQKDEKLEFEIEKEKFPEFDFKKEINKIKNVVYESDVKTGFNNEMIVNCNWDLFYEMIDDFSQLYFDKWIKLYPNAQIIEFSSDIGNSVEEFLRYNINHMIYYMQNNGIDGFKGENS